MNLASLNIVGWMMGLWYAHLRRIDIRILWPTCKAGASDLDHAKAAFAMHATNDEAWVVLGTEEMMRQIDELK